MTLGITLGVIAVIVLAVSAWMASGVSSTVGAMVMRDDGARKDRREGLVMMRSAAKWVFLASVLLAALEACCLGYALLGSAALPDRLYQAWKIMSVFSLLPLVFAAVIRMDARELDTSS